MARKIQPEDVAEEGPELTSESSPIEIVNLDEQIAAAVAPPDARSVSFWFGNGPELLKLPDGSEYHVQRNGATISDPALIANLKKLAENPANRIFIQ